METGGSQKCSGIDKKPPTIENNVRTAHCKLCTVNCYICVHPWIIANLKTDPPGRLKR